MMEAMSGSVTAAGIYLKVASGMDKEERDSRNRERGTQRRKMAKYEGEVAGEQGINSMSENEPVVGRPWQQRDN